MKKFTLLFFISLFIGMHLNAQVYQSPRLLLDEDFTDGKFDDFGSGDGGSNWNFGGLAKFDKVNGRPFDTAAVRYLKDGRGSGWDALIHWYDKDSTGKRQEILMDPEFDIQVLRFTGFSDGAGRNVSPEYGIEPAMLEDKSGAPFGHDMTFEAQQTFLKSNAPEGPLQLDANVENSNHVYITGTRTAHHSSGKESSTTLTQTYESEVIWRNRYNQGKTNIEQWGELNSADYDVNEEMKSSTAPIDSVYIKFNHLQIALFDRVDHSRFPTRTQLATGVDHDDAIMGVSHIHLGITKASDFNLDYKVNATDDSILIANAGQNNTTVKTGDANNDNVTDARDALILVAFKEKTTSTPSITVSGSYNASTGAIELSAQNANYIEIIGPANSLTGSPSYNGMNPTLTYKDDSTVVMYSKDGFDFSNVSIGSVYKTGLNVSELKLKINYDGSSEGHGIVKPISESIIISVEEYEQGFTFEGQQYVLDVNDGPYTIERVDLLGRVIESKSLVLGTNEYFETPGLRIVRVINGSGDVVKQSKYAIK